MVLRDAAVETRIESLEIQVALRGGLGMLPTSRFCSERRADSASDQQTRSQSVSPVRMVRFHASNSQTSVASRASITSGMERSPVNPSMSATHQPSGAK